MSYVVHFAHPSHLAGGFQLLADALRLCHLLYQPLKHLLSLPVNIHKIAVQFAACQQVGVKRFAVILFTFATPDKLFCLMLRYQSVVFDPGPFFKFQYGTPRCT